MNPADLRTARKALGLTQHGLAEALRMGKSGWQSVSRWEKDGNSIPGPVQVAVEALVAAQRIEARSDETPEEAVQPVGREPDGEADAPEHHSEHSIHSSSGRG